MEFLKIPYKLLELVLSIFSSCSLWVSMLIFVIKRVSVYKAVSNVL